MTAPATQPIALAPPPPAVPGIIPPGRQGKLIKLSTVRPQPITFLVPGRVPYGAVTVLAGRPGKGKSQLAVSLGASLAESKQPFIVVGAEDGLADTVRPRVEAAGGDPSLAYAFVVDAGGEDDIALLPNDIPALELAVKETGAPLVIVDPMAAHLSPELNSNNDHSVRQALGPLAKMAQRTGAAVLVVSHFKKSREGSPLDWIGGAGVQGVVRSALLFGEARAEDEFHQEYQRYLVHVKANGAALAKTMKCEIVPSRIYDEGRPISTSYVKFIKEMDKFYASELA